MLNWLVKIGCKKKNNYKDGSIWYGLSVALKINYCLIKNKFGNVDEHKTFTSFATLSDNLGRRQCFKTADVGELIAKVPLSWRKTFSQGVVNPHEKRNCSKCTKDNLCDGCDKIVNQTKEFSANLNELKRQPLNQFGRMLFKWIRVLM